MKQTYFLISAFLFSLLIGGAARASLCSGSYRADKDKGTQFKVSEFSASEVLNAYIECGLKSISVNRWPDIAGVSVDRIRAQLKNVDVQYVESIPSEWLPENQKDRGSAVFHYLDGNRWKILIVVKDLLNRHDGERYLLLFHELISTLHAELDLNFAVTLEFEFKALQANDADFQKLNVLDILVPQMQSKNSGPITSGGGDSTLLWLKRQLRNYFIDFYLVGIA